MKQLLDPAIEDYLRFRRSQDYSKGTLKADAQVLKRFLLVNGNVWCHALTEKHVNRHFEEVSRTRKPASLKNDHGVLTRFFKWARHTGRIPVEADPMFGRRQPKVTKRERNRVHVSEFDRLLDTAGQVTPRDRILVALLLYTLMRDSEVTQLRVGDVDLQGGWLSARITKTRTEDLMPICEELEDELRRWLTHYAEQVGPLHPHYFLVPARGVHPVHDENGRICRHESKYRPTSKIATCGRIVSPILERHGFPVRGEDGGGLGEGAHTVRRSGARALFDQLVANGYDHALRIVQSMLHHASVTQTETYIGITADRRSRNEILRGKRMYARPANNVVELVR